MVFCHEFDFSKKMPAEAVKNHQSQIVMFKKRVCVCVCDTDQFKKKRLKKGNNCYNKYQTIKILKKS